MPEFKHYTKRHLEHALKEIEAAIYTVVGALEMRAWCTAEPTPFRERFSGTERSLAVGDKWGGLFDCAWFHFTGRIPEAAAGQPVVALLDVNGEMCVYDDQGVPVRGLTSVISAFDYRLGRPGKRVLPLTARARGGEPVDIWADAGCNDLFGNLQGNGAVKEAAVAICDEQVRGLFYDFEVLWDFLGVLPTDSPRYQQILTGLTDAVHVLYGGICQGAGPARAILAGLLAQRGGDPSLRVAAVGHAHMDLGWLWPIRETIRKGARTFSTAIANIEKYPDYIFGASQPQYFLWMKQHYPALYARIKDLVSKGRIEPQGCMWVEADTNVSGGEALVRQILLGKRFFRAEFGVDVRYLWLPDVFGYSAALPQLLKKSGVDYFSTQKLSWSLINTFPHQSFHWRGLDGATVLTHMLPEETYNSPAAPRSVRKIEQNYKDSGVSGHALMVFGIGDGGGGPGEEHLERLARLRDLAGLSPVKQQWVAHFLEEWQADAGRFATWSGELYLERHEGTLTTQARNKWYNRKLELALRELEWTAVVAGLTTNTDYPGERLEKLWQEVLLYQFHDILPGSSIKRVYDESLARYAEMHREATEGIAANDAGLAATVNTGRMAQPVLVRNSLSWERTEWVQARGRWVKATVPPMGYLLVDAATAPYVKDAPRNDAMPGLAATESTLENDVLRVTFDSDGSIASVYDKRARREVIAEGEHANRLAVYADLGDAWDFPMDYAEQTPRFMKLVAATPRLAGPRAIVEQVYLLGHSELIQEIVLTAGSSRLDFVSKLCWREPRTMLRTSFPVAIHADEATFDIQFGHIRRPTHRNTTWDLARDEVAAHKWADLSQGDYGCALLNDSKYGHKVKGNVLDLNLLRSVPYPGPRHVQDADVTAGEPHHAYTDQADHHFTYALLPHQGDHIAGGVIRAGYELNVPLRVLAEGVGGGEGPISASFVEVDAPNVIIEAVKKTEDGDDIIVRLYESEHKAARACLRFGFPIAAAGEVNLMEEASASLSVRVNGVTLDFRPFEIKTVRVTPA
ncbi:MAG: alpha-mannosidase [Chloroflexi bacterium]|nr:alpha-mannosidase [Chloroflexota bacterium]